MSHNLVFARNIFCILCCYAKYNNWQVYARHNTGYFVLKKNNNLAGALRNVCGVNYARDQKPHIFIKLSHAEACKIYPTIPFWNRSNLYSNTNIKFPETPYDHRNDPRNPNKADREVNIPTDSSIFDNLASCNCHTFPDATDIMLSDISCSVGEKYFKDFFKPNHPTNSIELNFLTRFEKFLLAAKNEARV